MGNKADREKYFESVNKTQSGIYWCGGIPSRMRIPKFIHLEVTTECHYECPQCYIRSHSDFYVSEMNFSLCSDIISQAASMKIPYILITGGEPLRYTYLTECISLISSSGIRSLISTSGIGLTEEMSRALYSSGLHQACVSLNGSVPEIHNLSRTNHEAAVNAVKLFKSAGIRTCVNWVARKDNLSDFPELVKLCRKSGADSIDILACKDGELSQSLNHKELCILADMISDIKDGFVNAELCYEKLHNALKHPNSAFGGKCGGGCIFFDVLTDGSKTVCRHISSEISEHTKNMTLRKFWQFAGNLIKTSRICQCD